MIVWLDVGFNGIGGLFDDCEELEYEFLYVGCQWGYEGNVVQVIVDLWWDGN